MTQNPSHTHRQIAFVLNDIAEYQHLVADMADNTEVYMIDASGDALAKMIDILSNHSNLDAIHLFSHGSAGALQLGNRILTSDNLSLYTEQLTSIGQSLTENGDILLYGCNVASGATGLDFIGKLAQATGADIAASDDLTGNSALGGDWVLEKHRGVIEAKALDVASWQGVLTPTISLPTTATDFTKGGDPIQLAANATIANPDNISITEVRIALAGQTATDLLAFTAANGITGQYNVQTGVLILTGNATTAQWQTALRSVTYSSSDANAASTPA